VKVKGSLGCNDHEIEEFEILRLGSKVTNKITSLDFIRDNFDLFQEVLGRVLPNGALEGRGAQHSRISSSKLQNFPCQQAGSKTKTPGGLHG